jgi:hypothetical protein
MLTGCASHLNEADLPKIPDGEARIIVTRNSNISGAFSTVSIYLDDRRSALDE